MMKRKQREERLLILLVGPVVVLRGASLFLVFVSEPGVAGDAFGIFAKVLGCSLRQQLLEEGTW